MKKLIVGTLFAAMSSLTFPAMAQDASGSENSSNAGGLANAYNYSIPSTASGTCCGRYYDHKHANGNAVVVMTNFNQKLAAMQLAIIEAMRLSTGQLSGNLREQSGAEHTLADQQDDRATVKAVEEARLQAIRDAESGASSCRVISGSRGGGATKARNEYAQKVAESLGKWERGEEGPSKDGQSAGTLARLAMHCQMFATKADIEAGICQEDGNLPGADITASMSLFHKKGGLTASQSDERKDATLAFIQNAITPFSYTPIDKTAANTQAGREEAARRNAQQARSSIAQEVLSRAAAERAGSTDSDLVSWAKGMTKDMAGYSNANFDDGVSHYDMLEIYSRGFLLNPDAMMVADETPVSAIKDIKNMSAVQLYQGWEIIQHLERISVTLAAQLAILNEGTRTDIVKQ